MADVTQDRPRVSPNLSAALLLAAIDQLRELALPCPTAQQVIAATGAGQTRAYELKHELLERLPDIQRPVGRPAAKRAAPADTSELTLSSLGYVMDHAGCVSGSPERRTYAHGFVHFIVGLRSQYPDLRLTDFADALRLPLGTVEDWLRPNRPKPAEADEERSKPPDLALGPRVETILKQWRGWHTGFVPFCDHLKENLRISYSVDTIATILEAYGVRSRNRRSGRSPNEKALRGAFEVFFPGAQWGGDGSQITARINGETFTFNLELMVDTYSDAAVGASVREEEDAAAVIEAFNDGVKTTGKPPLAIVMDNKSCNDTDEVLEVFGATMRIRTTKGRSQNNAFPEGSFGLFKRSVPSIDVHTESPEVLARELVVLVVESFYRALNHRPRRDRQGRSRVDIHQSERPTAEQVKQAKADLRERQRKQELADKTRRARQDPTVRKALDEAFDRLGLPDPKGNIRSAIAAYPLDHVLAGIAIFERKQKAGRLPEDAEGRYLLGIVENLDGEDQGMQLAEALLDARLEARDHMLSSLVSRLETITSSASSALDGCTKIIDEAMRTDRHIEELFWLNAVANLILAQPPSEQRALALASVRLVHRSYKAKRTKRRTFARRLLGKAVPVEDAPLPDPPPV